MCLTVKDTANSRKIAVLKATMESHNNVADTLKGVSNDLQVQLGRVERKQHDPFYQDIALATGSAPLPLADMLTDTDATDVKTIEDTQAKTFVQVVKAATVAPKKQLQLHTATMAQLLIIEQPCSLYARPIITHGRMVLTAHDVIAVNRTKFASVFATRFMQNLDQEVLQRYLQEKLKFDVKSEKIVTGRRHFASFHITAECLTLRYLWNLTYGLMVHMYDGIISLENLGILQQ